MKTIAPADLAKLWKDGKNFELVDVRTPIEYREMHIEMARNVPLDQLNPAMLMQSRQGSPGDPLYFICRSGKRGGEACEKMIKAGVENVVNVEGGTLACLESGLPILRGKGVISLERQVRITAGFLVCLGALLSWLVHPLWILLSAFVGAGLMFAGITNTCGMGLLLAKMPWNRTVDASSCQCTPKNP